MYSTLVLSYYYIGDQSGMEVWCIQTLHANLGSELSIMRGHICQVVVDDMQYILVLFHSTGSPKEATILWVSSSAPTTPAARMCTLTSSVWPSARHRAPSTHAVSPLCPSTGFLFLPLLTDDYTFTISSIISGVPLELHIACSLVFSIHGPI